MKPDLKAIRERAEKATRGPWFTNESKTVISRDYYYQNPNSILASISLKGVKTGEEAMNNAEFIAHARTDIPALLDYIDKLEAVTEAAREYLIVHVCDTLAKLDGDNQ